MKILYNETKARYVNLDAVYEIWARTNKIDLMQPIIAEEDAYYYLGKPISANNWRGGGRVNPIFLHKSVFDVVPSEFREEDWL